MSLCPKNKSSKGHRDSRRANWKMNVPLDLESMLFKTDEHPLPFYRVNVGVQQFDEFYETYDVKEGDGMYLEPDKRVKVW